MTTKYYFRIVNSLLCLALLSLSFMASNCNDILNALGSGDVVGTWRLTAQSGAQYDVCPGEVVQYNSTTATLTCTGSAPISRSYTASNGVLTYETGISYNYGVAIQGDSTVLTMEGKNISRNLQYTKTSNTDSQSAGPQQKSDKQNLSNSSELK